MNDPIREFAESAILKTILEKVSELTQAFSPNASYAHLTAIKTGATFLIASFQPVVEDDEAPIDPEPVEEASPDDDEPSVS